MYRDTHLCLTSHLRLLATIIQIQTYLTKKADGLWLQTSKLDFKFCILLQMYRTTDAVILFSSLQVFTCFIQWCNQELFSTTRPTIEADRKAFIIFGRKRKCRRKWNSIYYRKQNEKENGHSFSAEKRKWKSPDNITVLFSFSYIQSPSQPYNAPPIPRPVSSIFSSFMGFHFPHVQCIDIFVAFFWMTFQPVNSLLSWFIATEWKQFSSLCTLLYWRLCSLTNSPHC